MQPYKKGYLDVGEGHKLYYEFIGNRKGIPVVFLHGGPGAGFNKKHREFFDFKKYNVLFFDQRGAGKSRPFATINANTTDRLVEDINKVMEFAGVEKAIIFGGSWGSTLALVYAVKYPEKVRGMVLRGIYLASKEDDTFYTENAKYMYPKEYQRMMSNVPENERKNIVKYYHKRMMGKNIKERQKYAFEWSLYEHSILSLVPDKNPEKSIKKYPYLSLGVLETYYLSNGCFIPEGYILKNAHKLRMPVSITHGRYDCVCPFSSAWKLHKSIPKSRFNIAISGHSASDPAMKKKLIEELGHITSKIRRF